MIIYIVSYFYNNGTYAGIVGAYKNNELALSEITKQKHDYSDCIFIVTETLLDG